MKKTNNSIEDLDVAFVEGAISSPSQEKELQKIRDNCKYLVTIGACACTGQEVKGIPADELRK